MPIRLKNTTPKRRAYLPFLFTCLFYFQGVTAQGNKSMDATHSPGASQFKAFVNSHRHSYPLLIKQDSMTRENETLRITNNALHAEIRQERGKRKTGDALWNILLTVERRQIDSLAGDTSGLVSGSSSSGFIITVDTSQYVQFSLLLSDTLYAKQHFPQFYASLREGRILVNAITMPIPVMSSYHGLSLPVVPGNMLSEGSSSDLVGIAQKLENYIIDYTTRHSCSISYIDCLKYERGNFKPDDWKDIIQTRRLFIELLGEKCN
jgi:hypothetical protein